MQRRPMSPPPRVIGGENHGPDRLADIDRLAIVANVCTANVRPRCLDRWIVNLRPLAHAEVRLQVGAKDRFNPPRRILSRTRPRIHQLGLHLGLEVVERSAVLNRRIDAIEGELNHVGLCGAGNGESALALIGVEPVELLARHR